jgi:hypothetical protein
MRRAGNTEIDEHGGNDDSFVSRWSRRKLESKRRAENTAADNATEDRPAEQAAEALQSPETILTDIDMPDIETMTQDSDYTGFLSPGVSDKLRKRALRKLFHSEVFNICDGLDDYDDDYTQFKSLGNILTADMRHQIELKAQRVAEKMLQEKQYSHSHNSSDADDDQLTVLSERDSNEAEQNETPSDALAAITTRQHLPAVDADHRDNASRSVIDTETNNETRHETQYKKHVAEADTEIGNSETENNL